MHISLAEVERLFAARKRLEELASEDPTIIPVLLLRGVLYARNQLGNLWHLDIKDETYRAVVVLPTCEVEWYVFLIPVLFVEVVPEILQYTVSRCGGG